jgi:branched-chain amino acid transport system substrate-binding protein
MSAHVKGGKEMTLRKLCLAAAALAVTATTVAVAPASADEQFIPLLVYRTGPYAPNGTPLADGQANYLELINKRDGGVGGVTITYEECETEYNNDKGVECYERLKANASAVSPYSTGITYALIEKARADKIPVLSMGYGRADATIGSVFPHVFTLPVTYWAQADALVQYAKAQEGGSLQGKKIALVYHDSAYGKEPIPTLETLAETYGYELSLFPVAHPGLEQTSTWLKIGRQLRPDWTLLWGWGVMNSTAIKEAAAVGYPMDHFIGGWWSGSEPDVEPAGESGQGYKSATFHAPGTDYPVFEDIFEYVYDKGLGTGEQEDVGEVLYNRGLINALIVVEAIRAAQAIHGEQPLTGAQVRDGLENLDITEERLAELGMTGFTPPIQVTCADHEGDHAVRVQQWDGDSWEFISEWITPMKDVVRPMIEASASEYAAQNNIELRDCANGG